MRVGVEPGGERSLSSALALRLDEANDEVDLILHRQECSGQVNPGGCSDPRRIAHSYVDNAKGSR
jgi:hypothetical protein